MAAWAAVLGLGFTGLEVALPLGLEVDADWSSDLLVFLDGVE